MCILGYCVFPLDIAALMNLLIGLAFKSVLLKAIIVAIGFAWATRGAWRGQPKRVDSDNNNLACSSPHHHLMRIPSHNKHQTASVIFIGQVISPERKVLALYPVFFFYTFLAWLVLIQ